MLQSRSCERYSGNISDYYKDLLLEEALQDMVQIERDKCIDLIPHDETRIESIMTYMRCFYNDPCVSEQYLFFSRVRENRIRQVDNPERWLELVVRGAYYHINDFGLFRDLVFTLSVLFLLPATNGWGSRVRSPHLVALFLDLQGGDVLVQDMSCWYTNPRSPHLMDCLTKRRLLLRGIRSVIMNQHLVLHQFSLLPRLRHRKRRDEKDLRVIEVGRVPRRAAD